MRVILFGATGMVGEGVLRECILDPEVTAVLSVVRRTSGPGLGRRSENRVMYTGLKPFLPVLLRRFPKYVTTTEQVGRAMLGVAKNGYSKRVLEEVDIASV